MASNDPARVIAAEIQPWLEETGSGEKWGVMDSLHCAHDIITALQTEGWRIVPAESVVPGQGVVPTSQPLDPDRVPPSHNPAPTSDTLDGD